MSTFSSDTSFKLKALGIYQLVFAMPGLGLTLWLLLKEGIQFRAITFVYVAVALLYVFGVYCGIMCFQTSRRCLQYSSINQYLQLFSFSIGGYGFMYCAGFLLNLGFDLTGDFLVSFKVELFSMWHIEFDSHSNVILVNLNIAALLVIFIIDRLKKEMKQEIEAELLAIDGEVKPGSHQSNNSNLL